MQRKFVTKQKINANFVLLLCDTLIAATRSKVITAAGDFLQMLPFEMQIDYMRPLSFAPSLAVEVQELTRAACVFCRRRLCREVIITLWR